MNIQFTSNWLIDTMRDFTKQAGITYQQYKLLCILRESIVPVSTKELKKRMFEKMSDMSRLVNRLVLKEYVNKRINPIDKRLIEVVISEKGLNLLAKLDEKNIKLDKLIASLSSEEISILNLLLEKLYTSKN